MHAARGTNRKNLRSVCSHRTAVSSGRCGGIAHMTGALPGIDTGALGRAGWDGGGRQSHPLHESRRNAQSSA